MKYKLLCCQFIGFFFLCGCLNSKQAESIAVLNHQTINLDEDFVGYGGFLALHQDIIVGIEMASSMPPFFYFKQNGSSQTLSHFGNRGQGPNDFLMPYSIQYIHNQTMGTWNLMTGTYYEFRIPNENEELKIDKKIRFETPLTRITKTSFNQYIGLSADERMFLLADSTGKPIHTFFEYPYQDNDERQFATRAHAYQGTLATNPSKNKFVYSSFHGEIIHFYAISA